MFDAKVEAALRHLERSIDLVDFETIRLRVLEGRPGRDVARALGTSEPTVSRRLARARGALQRHLATVFERYAVGPEERSEAERKGLGPSPNKEDGATPDDLAFDEAIAETYARLTQRRATGTPR